MEIKIGAKVRILDTTDINRHCIGSIGHVVEVPPTDPTMVGVHFDDMPKTHAYLFPEFGIEKVVGE